MRKNWLINVSEEPDVTNTTFDNGRSLRELIAAEGGITFVGRDEVRKMVLKIDYHFTEKTRRGRKRSQ